MPLVLNAPALTHQTQQCFWSRAQAREVVVGLLAADLAVQGLLVAFHRQEQVGPPWRGTSENRLRGVQSNSFGEGFAYRLNQHTIEIQAAQQLLEGCALAGFPSVVSLLGQGDAERTGLHRDLGDISAVGRRP